MDFNVDITIDEIIPLYNEKIKNLPKSRNSIIPIDVEAKILDVLANINSRELEILVYLNKAILNFLMGNNAILKSMSDTFANKELFEVIL
ncbi:MAG: hypothetical protein LBU14_05940 [Candidatus Peribacteria bacterium]|nr:hypothetical protein [Candidatus Peribacteria bacterium]